MVEFVVDEKNVSEKNNLKIFEKIKKLEEEIKLLKETAKTINNIQNNFYCVPMDFYG